MKKILEKHLFFWSKKIIVVVLWLYVVNLLTGLFFCNALSWGQSQRPASWQNIWDISITVFQNPFLMFFQFVLFAPILLVLSFATLVALFWVTKTLILPKIGNTKS